MSISLISIALLLVLLAATLVAVAVALYLNRWRRRLLADPHLIFEEKISSRERDPKAPAAGLDQSITDNIKIYQEKNIAIEKSIADLGSTFMTLQTALDERDAEIRRLKEGYDRYIFEKFVGRFIRVDLVIQDFLAEEKTGKDGIEQIRDVLEDALDECGVERFTPTLGESFLHADGVDDSPIVVAPKTQEDEYKILEILEPGYRIRGQEGFKVVRASKVRISGPWKGEYQP